MIVFGTKDRIGFIRSHDELADSLMGVSVSHRSILDYVGTYGLTIPLDSDSVDYEIAINGATRLGLKLDDYGDRLAGRRYFIVSGDARMYLVLTRSVTHTKTGTNLRRAIPNRIRPPAKGWWVVSDCDDDELRGRIVGYAWDDPSIAEMEHRLAINEPLRAKPEWHTITDIARHVSGETEITTDA